MLGFMRAIKIGSTVVAAAIILLSTLSLSHAQTAPTGSIRLNVGKAGFIVGIGGGSGTLRFQGRDYPVSVGGISIGTIGVAGADLVGRVYNLRTAADIAGTYTAVSGGIAIAGGAKAAPVQNANGVVMELQGTQAGFEVSLGYANLVGARPKPRDRPIGCALISNAGWTVTSNWATQ